MIIGEQQFAAFQQDEWRRFEDRVVAHLAGSFRSLLMQRRLNEVATRALIGRCANCAGAFGIVGEEDLTRFIEYAVEYGEGFDLEPWAAGVLNAADISPDEKMDRLDAVTAFTLR